MHALTCPVRRHWLRWRIGIPFWRDDKVAQALDIAQYGCPRCGRGAVEERNRVLPPDADCCVSCGHLLSIHQPKCEGCVCPRPFPPGEPS